MLCRCHEMKSFLHVVHKVDIAVCVRTIDVGKLDCGAGMAAIENNEESAAWGEFGNETAMECVAVYLAILQIVDRDDCVIEAAVSITIWILHLSTVAGIVQEALGVWFRD